MKKLALVLLFIGGCFLRADDTAQNSKWAQDYRHSQDLAVKLYPEAANPNSELAHMTTVVHHQLVATDSRLPHLSTYPLILCAYEAGKLGIEPQLGNLTDQERYDVYCALQGTLACTKDFAAVTQVSDSAPAPPSDNPQAGLNFTPPPTDTGTHHSMNELANNPAPNTPSSSGSNLRPPGIAAFHCYLYQTAYGVKFRSRNNTIEGGPYDGMNQQQATAQAKIDWAAMSEDQKAPYEQMAETTGDPIAEYEQHVRDSNGDPYAHGAQPVTTIHEDGSTTDDVIVHP